MDVGSLEALEELPQSRFGELVGDRIPAFWNEVLADHHLDPRPGVEQFVEARGYSPGRAKQINFVLEQLRHLHRAKLVPEGVTFPLVEMVMEDDEVADVLHLETGALVEIISH